MLPFDINKPDPANPQWGPDVTAIRDNLASIVMYAAANGGRIPDWDTVFVYDGGTGDLTTMTLTNKTHTGIKVRVTYTYSGGNLNKESYFFDKGLGGGFELVANGVLTYAYSGGDVSGITAANS